MKFRRWVVIKDLGDMNRHLSKAITVIVTNVMLMKKAALLTVITSMTSTSN